MIINRFSLFYFSVAILISFTSYGQKKENLIQYVQPLIGTSGSTVPAAVKHGEGTEKLANTIPAVGVPFGMTQWTPQTRTSEKKCLAPYYYKDSLITGFRSSHWLSGSCTQDYGSFTIMPVGGTLKTNMEEYAAPFSHKDEVAGPDYYRLDIKKYNVKAEMTALTRSSIFQFTMLQDDSLYILVSPNSDQEKAFVKVDQDRREIIGYNPAFRIYQGWGNPAGFSGYFVIQVDKPFIVKGTFTEGKISSDDSVQNKKNLGAYIGFKLKKGEQLKIKIGTSFTGIRNARKNLLSEISHWDFNKVRSQSSALWESSLQKIKATGGSLKDKRIFYTALYHSLQHPRIYNDVDGSYPQFAHEYENEKLKEGNYYDDFSMWDIYRAQIPLMEIIEPEKTNDFVSSLILKGKQGGWLPIFPCWNSYTGAMVGDHAISVIASAYLKGIRNYDIESAYRLMRKNAFVSPTDKEYLDGKGRRALSTYLRYGYIPLEDSVKDAFHKMEQVSRTLEYAYDDYALALVAKELGKKDDYETLLKRSHNYQNVFDTSTGFVRGRTSSGEWTTPFYPDKKMSFITEGTPRQYTFYTPHDITGLSKLMGGTKKLESALDSIFQKGEYWHGNEPGHHIPFLYNYTSTPWKTQSEVRKILSEEYSDGPGGLSGNDDAGQMSAWYVFAAIGLYPVSPVSGEYAITSPAFDEVTLQLADNKKMKIITKKRSSKDIYIQSVKLEGKLLNKNFIHYADLIKGGKLEIELTDKTN